ncbi:hypothetical protein J8F10_20260 [Gemmata sp. G18]|uniref:Lipoprotein n=1 Tax=Gemmata palustris TaxID=2822762 RepID=A0ABS5BV96_9BACT|nr:hypothetical protein [Gemmata palustris]MBP3957589.1 hypothetical protein [Gemmata palustris]
MRGFTLRAVPVYFVAFACGCFGKQDVQRTDGAPPSPTHAYWRQVSAVLAQKPAGENIPAYVSLVRTQTDGLRDLPTDGVDADLVSAVASVIKCEDVVLQRADLIDNDPARLKESKELAQAFSSANRAAAESKKRLKALQPALNSRHGGGFAPMG